MSELEPFSLENAGLASFKSEAIDVIIDREKRDLIALVQALQKELGFLPREALAHVSRRTGVPLARVYGAVTFYTSLFLHPRGRHVVRVCHGTACHVSKAAELTEALGERLGILSGETTPDLDFTLEEAACFGCCSLAPTLRVGDVTYGRVTRPKAIDIIDNLVGTSDAKSCQRRSQ